jgi:hypothetical protein
MAPRDHLLELANKRGELLVAEIRLGRNRVVEGSSPSSPPEGVVTINAH